MKIKNTLFGLIMGVSLLASSQVQSAMFAKYDGIDGESADSNHDKWIDVLSIDWGVAREEDPASGELAAPKPKPFRIKKRIDKSSPLLMMETVVGPSPETGRNLVIEITRVSGDVYLRYELKNVLVTSYQVSGSGQAEDVPSEDFSLNFEEIKVTYIPQVGDEVVSTWRRAPVDPR